MPCVLVLISSAAFATPFSFLAGLVLPLAAMGFVAAAALLFAAVQRREFLGRTGTTAAYSTLMLLLVAFAPGVFGSRYYTYRQHAPTEDVIQVIPKMGQPVAGIPKDADWVDASRFGLEENRTIVEIVNVANGKVEVRTAGGSLKTASEQYLVIWLRRRQAGDAQEFAKHSHAPREGMDAGLALKVTDDQGREYPRQNVDLGWNAAGVKRDSSVFPTSMTDDVFAFAPPAADVESLRLEITSPQFTKPLRFTIPKSMISRRIR